MKIRSLFVLSTLLICPLVAAGDSGYEFARVVDVEPIRETHRTPIEREVCREEEIYVRERPNSAGSTLLGAVIGGVLGSQIGSGSGRDAATAAGAVIGGAIGHDAADRRGERIRPVVRERCHLERDWRERTVHGGYRVTYEYAGRLHRTVMDSHPGDRIRVRVDIRPLDH